MKFLQRFTRRAAIQSKHLHALDEKASLALADKRFDEAIRLYGEIIKINGDDAKPFYKRANANNGLGHWEEALTDYDRALGLDPDYAYAYCNRGAVLEQLGRFAESLADYDRAIQIDPGDFLTYYNRGSALKALGRFSDALISYERAIMLNGNHAPSLVNRGNVLHKMRSYEAAIASYDRAIKLNSSIPEAYLGRGVSLVRVRRFREALEDYDHAIALNSGYAEAYCNKGNALQELAQHDAALSNFGKALELKPSFSAALQGSGFSLMRLQRFEAAAENYNHAMTIDAGRRYLLGMLAQSQMHICDWTKRTTVLGKLVQGLQAGDPASVPLPVLALVDSPELHRKVAEIWAKSECPADDSLGPIPPRLRSGRIRIGYFSSDFCEHAVSQVAAELFELHDGSRFETIAFASGPRVDDHMRIRLRNAFHEFIDVREKSDRDVAILARSLGIDIAVDLNGYTEYSRTNVFALRAAPIQINYLGYPGTMGAEYMDYLIADRTVVPESCQDHYTEKIVYMPDCYLPHDATRTFSREESTREQLGLPSSGFVFCCFNNNYKIAPDVFSTWMRILKRTGNSVLWLAQNDPVTARNLRGEAQSKGVDPARLIFATRTDSLSIHLARLSRADLFLDTLPYNAHATATDALWAGVPLLTRRGEAFAGRVAASVLMAAGLPELIVATEDEYEELAVKLSNNPDLLAHIKGRLLLSHNTAPLFNSRLFARNLESAYVKILERYETGLQPDHIYVDGHSG